MKNSGESIFIPNRILTVPQAAEQLQVSTRTVYEWLRGGKLPGRKIGKVWRLSADAIVDFLRDDVVMNTAKVNSPRP